MKKRKLISRILGLLVIIATAWLSAAYVRQDCIRQDMLDVVRYRQAEAEVEVPIAPLLINPLRKDPTIHLYIPAS